jgi:lipopolysaccharide transport system permease protein
MQDFKITPREMIASFWRNRNLIKASIKRDVLGRYRGSMMGVLWSFFNPLLMLSVYTFVFSVIFPSRWGGSTSVSKTEFALILFSGMIIFNIFSECLNRAPSTIISNQNFVKKIIFPLEVLPVVNLGAALFHASIGLVVWLTTYAIFFGFPNPTTLCLPIVLLPLCLLLLGISWIFSSLGTYLRDLGQVVGVLTTILLFMSPIFYPVSAIPEDYRFFLFFNPITSVIEQSRDVLFWGKYPDWNILFVNSIGTFVFAWIGFIWFQKTRKGFADVL